MDFYFRKHSSCQLLGVMLEMNSAQHKIAELIRKSSTYNRGLLQMMAIGVQHTLQVTTILFWYP